MEKEKIKNLHMDLTLRCAYTHMDYLEIRAEVYSILNRYNFSARAAEFILFELHKDVKNCAAI